MLPGMSDTTPDPTARQTGANDATRAMLPVAEAAAALGITSDAVRARIRRGKMHGEKRGGAWFVFVPDTERPDSDTTEPDELIDRRDTEPGEPDTTENVTTLNTADATTRPHDATANATDTTAVNIALVELVDDLTRRNADLSAAAAMWQTRAAHLEDRLRQLSAGGSDQAEATESPESTAQSTNTGTYRVRTSTSTAGILERLRRWLRRSD